MLAGQSQSTITCYKTSLTVFLISTLAAIYALRPPLSPPGEWMRHLTSVRDVVRNRSTAIFGVVLGSYGSSTSGSATPTTDPLIASSPEDPTANKTGRYVSMCPGNFDNRRVGNELFSLAPKDATRGSILPSCLSVTDWDVASHWTQ